MSAQTAIERIQRALSIAETTSAENPHNDVGLAAAHNQGILFFLMDEVRESIQEYAFAHYQKVRDEIRAENETIEIYPPLTPVAECSLCGTLCVAPTRDLAWEYGEKHSREKGLGAGHMIRVRELTPDQVRAGNLIPDLFADHFFKEMKR